MATTFRTADDLRSAVADRSFDRPPAIVCNAHVTGLGVARALAAHDVPVITVDRNGLGVAPYSTAVDLAGEVTFPLDDLDGFREDIESIAAETGHEPVAFGCMDEWALAFAETEPEGVRLPFSDHETVEAVLNKESLYATAGRLGVPYPETCRLRGIGEKSSVNQKGRPRLCDPDEAADRLGFPLVIKPARKREFEEAVGTNVIEVESRSAYHDVIETAREKNIRIMAQEKIPVSIGDDCSLASYVPPEGDPLAVVGNARVRSPRGFGTSCVVDIVDSREVRDRALSVIEETGYHGISEAEFVYDESREEYVLLDVNTRPWKWIDLPVTAGANLPMAAYASVTDATYESDGVRDARWVSLADYLSLLSEDDSFVDVLGRSEWEALFSGAFENRDDLTTGVYRPSDPTPTYRLLQTEFGNQEYYCAC